LAHNSKRYFSARNQINMAETDVPNWLNISFFETALRSGTYGPSVTVTSIEIGRATGAGDNYVCEIYRAELQVILEGRRMTVSLIVKAQPVKGEMSTVNILSCIMIKIREILSILIHKIISKFVSNIHPFRMRIYLLQLCTLL
jgi:hypothetical protein